MTRNSALFNNQFLGSQFSWWIGQVASSDNWRENQTDKSYDKKDDIPGWGYRYKVRIMGIHDAGEDSIPSDQLPWCQVMFSVWGGGQGGSFQTPGIKAGMFVFGFFLDGDDEQVPIIMGVLGNNAKTIIKGLGSSDEPNTFEPKSAFTDEPKNEGGVAVRSSCIAIEEPSSPPTHEGGDYVNKNNAATIIEEEINDEEHSIACPKHGDPFSGIQTTMSEFQKKYAKLSEKLNQFPTAAAQEGIQEGMDKLIESTSELAANDLKPSVNNIQSFISTKLSDATKDLNKLANLPDALDNMQKEIEGQSKLGCVFNKIRGDLAGLIGAAMKRSLKRKNNQSPPARAGESRPTSPESELIPPLPQEGFYTPTPPCETEEIISDVFSNIMGDITNGYTSAVITLSPESGNTRSTLSDKISQENVIANLENGKLFGGLASALGAAVGIDANQSGSISTALKSGNYAAALTSLVNFSGSNTAINGLSSAIQSIDNGDIVGAFTGIAGPLGIDSALMGGVGGALSAIKTGNMTSLTNAIAGLGGQAPQILNDVLGGRLPISGIDLPGFGALGGLNFDMSLASTFLSSVAAFQECSPPPVCAPNDKHTLGKGGDKNDKLNEKEIATKTGTKEKEGVKPPGLPSKDDLQKLYDKNKPGGIAGAAALGDLGVGDALGRRLPTNALGNLESFDSFKDRLTSANNLPINVKPNPKFKKPNKKKEE